MKQFVFIILISLFIPWSSFAHLSFNQDVKNSDRSESFGSLNLPGGKKKKPVPKKEVKPQTKATPQKEAAKKEEVVKKEKNAKKEKKPKAEKKEGSEQYAFYAGPELSFGFPVGKIRDSLNNGIGFQVRGEYFFKPNINVGLTTGFRSYKYDQVMVGKGHFTYIPVKLTGTYYFSQENFRPYVNFGLGAYLVKEKYDAESWTWVQNPETNRIDTLYEVKHLNEKQTCIGLSPSVGVLYQVQDEFFANFSLGYDLIFTKKKASSFIGINLGLVYRFGF